MFRTQVSLTMAYQEGEFLFPRPTRMICRIESYITITAKGDIDQ